MAWYKLFYKFRTKFCGGLSLLWVIQSHEKQTPSRIRFVLSNPKLDHIKFDYGVPVHPLVCDINATSQILETFFDFLFNWMHRRCNGTSSGPKLKVSFWSGEDSRVQFLLCCQVDWIAIKPILVMGYVLSDVFCTGL